MAEPPIDQSSSVGREIRATTRIAGVVGSPVRHSLSPAIHNAAFAELGLDWAYGAFEVEEEAIRPAIEAVRALGFGGLSVTMPFKEAVAGLVDELTDVALALGAVNCVVPHDGRLVGHNTDGAGFVDAVRAGGFEPAGQRCVVLGAGGAARAVVLALARAGAAEVAVVNRSADRAKLAARLAGTCGVVAQPGSVARADLVVNATPLGMATSGHDAEVPVDPELLQAGQIVVDLIYHPSKTRWLAEAAARGAQTSNGLGMLVHQAAHAFRLWTGVAAPIGVMWAAAEAELTRR